MHVLKNLGLTLTTHESILDNIRQVNFDLSMSLKVKRDGGFGLPVYHSYWCLMVIYGLAQLLYEL